MAPQNLIRAIATTWVLIAMAVYTLADPETFRSWLLLAVVEAVPPLILLMLVKERPPLMIAEILHDRETRP